MNYSSFLVVGWGEWVSAAPGKLGNLSQCCLELVFTEIQELSFCSGRMEECLFTHQFLCKEISDVLSCSFDSL